MATLRSFKGLRYTEKAGDIARVVCPPYDIISPQAAESYRAASPYNVIRLELSGEADPYAGARDTLKQYLREGVLREDGADSLYIYSESFSHGGRDYSFAGLIGQVGLCPFSEGVVLPHEETLSKAKDDRFRLVSATGCNFSQVYSLYHDGEGEHSTRAMIGAYTAAHRPEIGFTDGDGVTHRLWPVTDRAFIDRAAAQFRDRKLYIADGHHRYETSLNIQKARAEAGLIAGEGDGANFIMMMLVDIENPGLVIFPTHRVLKNLGQFDLAQVLQAAGEHFEIEHGSDLADIGPRLDSAYARGDKAFALCAGGDGWHLLTLRDPGVMAALQPDRSAAYRGLDVNILHSLILERQFGIDRANMAAGNNLVYTRDRDEAIALAQRGEAQCAFLINPTRVDEVAAVAAAGEKMPQKSTYFYPKLITGLVINRVFPIE